MATFGASAPALGSNSSIAPNDFNVPMAGDDGISSLSWSPRSNHLVSSNWDGGVRLWEVQEQGGRVQAVPRMQSKSDSSFSNCHLIL
jgi:mRNA export factor